MNEQAVELLDTKAIVQCLSESGPLSKIFSGFEERSGQKALAKKISECFNSDSVGIFEAETGVGKSLAYLLPSIQWAVQNNTRVIISTATINLQQQLIEKDAPLALRILNLPETFREKIVLVKGRRNFLCLRRFAQYAAQDSLFDNDADVLEKIKTAITAGNFSGSRDDIDFAIPPTAWANICSESDNCFSNRCPNFDACYVMKMKRKAEAAKILIANHHILFNDLLAKLESKNFDASAVLPSFHHVVLDEAHAIEEAASSGFSEAVNSFYLKRQLSSLYKTSGTKAAMRGKGSGVLNEVIALSSRVDLFAETVKSIFEVTLSFDNLEAVALSLIPNESTWSFLQSNDVDIQKLKQQIKKFSTQIFSLNKNLSIILQNIPEPDDEEIDYASEENIAVHEANVILSRLKDVQAFFEQYENHAELQDYIFWFEKMRTSSSEFVQFFKTPIALEKFMRAALFSPMNSVVCTSATLRVSDNFDFAFKNLGLQNFSEKEIEVGIFESPFPYDKNVLLNIPIDAPLPTDTKFNEYVCNFVLSLIEASGGRALVLFTSYSLLREATDFVKKRVSDDIRIFFQGELERAKLLSLFKADISSCLFATESFWTGVDVPGEALSHVILVKLPFSVPTHPVAFAKAAFIERRGGKPFFELSIPDAVIRFKQGFGRLMRSKSDKGVITVLDNRILKKSYGGIFLKSIPQVKQNFVPSEVIIKRTFEFLK